MTKHPITPPPELVQQWIDIDEGGPDVISRIAARAAQWAADQELEACCMWVGDGRRENLGKILALRAARRPKPPSLKEQALEALSEMEDDCLMVTHSATIRRALEALPND